MSEQGADKAGLTISEGVRFFLKSLGIGLFLALVFLFFAVFSRIYNRRKKQLAKKSAYFQ
ncbi:hypothetical protein [Mannheimia haemolytica]|uniref:hypothetical protein n=1 Tax=Mannheimia haemolytica TaxID=75985 RepID=UPI001F4843C7|nr:hypothetical protein [Mannheimia haemolytica]